jgi:hypothetical protein
VIAPSGVGDPVAEPVAASVATCVPAVVVPVGVSVGILRSAGKVGVWCAPLTTI